MGLLHTRLDKTEDLFINLNKVLRRWENTTGKIQWKPEDSDLSDFKLISFDYIRYVYNSPKGIDAKEVRERLTRNSEGSFFAHEKIWRDFANRHSKVDQITDAEKSIDEMRDESAIEDLSMLLKSRDENWARKVDSPIKENFGLAKQAIENLQDSNEPLKLLSAAHAKLESINVESPTFTKDQKIFELVDIIRKWADNTKKHILNNR